jgi:hypothetical protein
MAEPAPVVLTEEGVMTEALLLEVMVNSGRMMRLYAGQRPLSMQVNWRTPCDSLALTMMTFANVLPDTIPPFLFDAIDLHAGPNGYNTYGMTTSLDLVTTLVRRTSTRPPPEVVSASQHPWVVGQKRKAE